MDARNNIATDLFYKIRSRFQGLKLGAESGEITINPDEARFFDFDYMEGSTPIGHVSVSLAEPNSMKVYFSSGITESMDDGQKTNWYQFLRELRQFAKRRLLSFDTRDITKDNLDKRDYEFLSKNAQPKPTENTITTPVGESVMNESTLYGSKTVSYQKLMDTRLIIKHSQALQDDMQPGARSRNISGLFVENADGERFKYPFIHLAGARAMQRHVANGGLPYDDIGKSIINMSEEIAQLKSFSAYVVRNDLMNSDTNGIVERSSAALNSLREHIKALSKQSHYEAYKESFQAHQPLEVPQDVVEDFTEKFTVRNFKEDIKSVFPVLYRLMQTENTIGYDDIVEMTTNEEANEDVDIDVSQEAYDPFAKFENWAMTLGEESAVTSDDEEAQRTAIQSLQELVGQAFPVGVDGTDAIESLKGIIEDPELYKRIKALATEDANADAREQIQGWLQLNAPEALEQLDFGDMGAEAGAEEVPAEVAPEAGAEEVPAEPVPQEAVDPNNPRDYERPAIDRKKAGQEPLTMKDVKDKDEKSERDRKERAGIKVEELAEFIHSFYDRDSGTFPKGPEGVAIMVGKKFGEQAEQVARQFVERMAPQQADPQIAELARIRELSGTAPQVVRQQSVRDAGVGENAMELENIRRLSGIAQGLGM
jgi:hypothetical protein